MLWRLFGINLFDQERLYLDQFLQMCHVADQEVNSGDR